MGVGCRSRFGERHSLLRFGFCFWQRRSPGQAKRRVSELVTRFFNRRRAYVWQQFLAWLFNYRTAELALQFDHF
jgi:hypothetical protein